MKKKLLIGLSSIGLAAGFWACGDGTVEPMNEATDGYVKAMLETQSIDFATQVADAKKKCAEDPACENEMAKAQGSAVVISAESSDPLSSSSGISPLSSSSSMTIFKFSSGGDVGLQSSSSAPSVVVSSSSVEEEKPMEGMGRCFPSATTAEQGAAVTWSIEWNKQVVTDQDLFQSPKYNWTFDEGATPATATTKSASVSYSKWGQHSASVAVSVANGTKKSTLVCDKTVNVNGAPITGCTCELATPSVELTEDGTATWIIKGTCTSTAAITGYKWNGAVAAEDGLSATFTYTKVKQTDAPTVEVTNAESTILPLTCKAPQITDANNPETNITLAYGTGNATLNGGTLYHITYSSGRGSLVCHGSGTLTCGTSDPVEMTQYDAKVGDFTECGTVQVSAGGSAICANNW